MRTRLPAHPRSPGGAAYLAVVRFDFHMHGKTMGTLALEALQGGARSPHFPPRPTRPHDRAQAGRLPT